MKKLILIFIVGLFSLKAVAEEPPATYQKLKAEILSMQGDYKKSFNTEKQVKTGIAIGAVNAGLISVLHFTGNYQARRTVFFVGMGIHVMYHIIVTFANHQKKYL
jgi:hypothetical protein